MSDAIAQEDVLSVMNPVFRLSHFVGGWNLDGSFIRSVIFDVSFTVLHSSVDALWHYGGRVRNASNLSS